MSEVRVERSSGVGTGMVLGIAIVLLVVVVAAFAFFGGAFRGAPNTTQPNSPTNIQVNPPAAPPKVDINVNPPQAPANQAPAPAKP